jgi:DNA-binding MarR family transcriptional regulator
VQLDPKADQGVHDLRRILRTPGTYNHKSKYAPNYPQVIFYQKRFDLGYSLQGLKTILPAPVAPVTTTAHPQATTAHQDHHSTPYEGASVIDAYNAKHNLASMLVEYGYTHAGDNRYMRPGGKDSPGVELFPTENNARIWSSNDPLYSGDHRCTPFTVFCVYEHDGNVSKAVAVAAVEMALVRHPKTESIKAKLQICRQWAQTADFAALIPQELQSAKGYRTNATDKRLYSAYLDVLGKYGSFRGPISNQQLSLASGLSDGSVRNSKKRLIGANLIRQIEAPEGSDNTGAYWYELVLRPDFDSCVDCAVVDVVSAKPYRAKYATKVFTDNKMHDAFQRGGSKRQRQAATIKAIGPDALLLLDVVNDFGRQTQIEVAMRTHQSKYTVSRLVKRLDEYGIVTVEAEGTRRFVSLNSDWLETVNELAPKMPTYGMEFKRNLNAAVRTVDNCDRLIAKGAGDAEKLEKRREKAAQRAFDMMSCETAFYFDEERQAEIMRRLTRHDALHHGASATVNDMQKSLATANFISFLRSETAKPWMTKYDNGRLTRIAQTLEDNELLIAARHQMFVEDMTLPGQTPPAPTISAAEIYRHHQMALGGAA